MSQAKAYPSEKSEEEFQLRRLTTAGGLLVLLAVAYLFLMQSLSLWDTPTFLRELWPGLASILTFPFPAEWLEATKESGLGLLNSVLYMVIIGLMFFVYLKVVLGLFKGLELTSAASAKGFRLLLLITGTVLALLLLLPATLTSDLFGYVWYSRILAEHGDNPFISVPSSYAALDTGGWLHWTNYRDTPSAYGPLWVMFGAVLYAISDALGGDIAVHLLSHRFLAGAAHLLNVWLVWRVAGLLIERFKVGEPEERRVPEWWRNGNAARVAATVTYAWNPLILVEFGANGHNDVLMLSFILGAIWLHLLGRWRLAAAMLGLAALVKVVGLFFLPGYVWLLGREHWETVERRARLVRAAQGLGIVLLTLVAGYAPFWQGTATLAAVTEGASARLFAHSVGALLRFRLPEALVDLTSALNLDVPPWWSAEALGARLDRWARWIPLLLVALYAIAKTRPVRAFPQLLDAWGWALFAYLTIGAGWFWPWYVSWLVVPVAFLGAGRLFNATQILCATSLALYAYYRYMPVPLDWMPHWTGLLIWGPPLIYVAVTWLRARAASPLIQEG